ncbi:MAG: LLM class F420-dependent oxidoreductase [Candidatus Binatia bacterium]|nr:MAG: LLM class F420-dependent oxidoreductase [Candidatus Binatia bacterium]
MELGRVGIWTFALDLQPGQKAREAAAQIEALGYGAIWIPEAMGREAMTNAALLLSGTQRITIATGIASIWARDAMACAAAQKTLCEAYGGRFLLGLGVSHAPMVAVRGQRYDKPVSAMRQYLDAMDSAPFMSVPPAEPPKRVLAALHPKMLELARERAHGSHTYFVPPEHTAWAREQLGPHAILAVEQTAVLETDPQKAREVARRFMSVYLGLPNYVRNLERLGYSEDDIASGGSDRLVDAIVVWGDEEAIRRRVQAHLDAGASHVCVQVLDPDPRALPMPQWQRLAPALL